MRHNRTYWFFLLTLSITIMWLNICTKSCVVPKVWLVVEYLLSTHSTWAWSPVLGRNNHWFDYVLSNNIIKFFQNNLQKNIVFCGYASCKMWNELLMHCKMLCVDFSHKSQVTKRRTKVWQCLYFVSSLAEGTEVSNCRKPEVTWDSRKSKSAQDRPLPR